MRKKACLKLAVQALTPDLWPALEDLFGEKGAGVWARHIARGRAKKTGRRCLWSSSRSNFQPRLLPVDSRDSFSNSAALDSGSV